MTVDKKKSPAHRAKLSGTEQVLLYLENLDHPLKEEIVELRTLILSVNDGMTEHIKWNAPSFCVNQQDRITFRIFKKEFFQLIFHCGVKKTPFANGGPLFEDETGLLKWATGDRAVIQFDQASDVEENKEKIKAVINKWLEITKDI